MIDRRSIWGVTMLALGSLCGLVALRTGLAEDPMGQSLGRAVMTREGGLAEHGPKQRRLRQGTVLEKVKGQFRLAGDRVAFYPDKLEVTELTVLENLALERLAAIVVEERHRSWVVSGTVTEYRGKNYLLVSRAVMASAEPQATGKP